MNILDLDHLEVVPASQIEGGSAHSESFSGVYGTGSASFFSSATSSPIGNFTSTSGFIFGGGTTFGSAQAGGKTGFLSLP